MKCKVRIIKFLTTPYRQFDDDVTNALSGFQCPANYVQNVHNIHVKLVSCYTFRVFFICC